MEIYKYYYNTKEWKDLVNDSSLKGKVRDLAIDNHIKTKGEKVSIQDYFNDHQRNGWYNDKGYSYKCFGEVENCIERLIKAERDFDDDLSYCDAIERHPEDLCESRTDWEDMKSYADGLYYFIESLKSEIAEGKIISVKNSQ